jgi:methionine-gamma-lyase
MDRRTRCARRIADKRELGDPLTPPIVSASTFVFDSQADVDRCHETGRGYVYSRYGNPTVGEVERLLADLEGAERAVAFGSGMAAISTLLATLAGAGERIAAQRGLYGGSVELMEKVLPGFGIDVDWLSFEDLQKLTAERLAGCKLLYLETPINPTLRLVDLAAVARTAREAGVTTIVDSTFATPILQRPIEHGIDVVVHSATKYLGGHGDLIGGVAAGPTDLMGRVSSRRRLLGGTLDPFPAFLLYRGMRTLVVRMEAHCAGAEEVARELVADPRVDVVHYPGLEDHPDHVLACRQMDGFGGMVAFEVAGGAEAAERVHDRLKLIVRAGSLGGVESLVSIPARMSHRHLDEATRAATGVKTNLVRLSIGLEAPEDLLADLDQALG